MGWDIEFTHSAKAYSPDGRQVAISQNQATVQLVDRYTNENLHILAGHIAPVTVLAYSPCGKLLASGADDRTVRLWHTCTGMELAVFTGHNTSIKTLEYSPDGRFLVSGAEDKSEQRWLVGYTYQLLYEFDPKEVSCALKFLWEMERDELDFKYKPRSDESLSDSKYLSLLNPPRPDETKLGQVVRFLEEQKAYKTTTIK